MTQTHQRSRAGTSPARIRILNSLALVLAALLVVSGCSWPSGHAAPEGTTAQSLKEQKALDPEVKFPSQFTRDGTFQSHIDVSNIDFVYTLWPTKSTPRTHEWFARGNKHFSFSLTAYDLDRPLRAPFASKRRVWLGRIKVTSHSNAPHHRSQRPYHLNAEASRITFDPEPIRDDFGMLITSPKGSFELRNQTIRPLRVGTQGVILAFSATVHIETAPGSDNYFTRKIQQRVPITIYPGTLLTRATRIPVDSN